VPTYPIKNHPTLRLMRPPDSGYWHAQMFLNGKIIKRTTKQRLRKDAENFAKDWWLEKHIQARQGLPTEKAPLFDRFAQLVLEENQTLIDQGSRSRHLLTNETNRYKNGIKQFFANKFINEIKYKDLTEFVKVLTDRGLAPSSIYVHLVFIRKVFKKAMRLDYISHMPQFPTISVKQKPRGWFSMEEYEKLKEAANELANPLRRAELGMKKSRYAEIDEEIRNFILFIVNTFMRPSDVKLLKNKHVELVEKGRDSFLRINTPFSKTINSPIISMLAGAGIYTDIIDYQLKRGYGDGEDFVFFPQYTNDRDFVLLIIRNQLDTIMKHAGLKTSGSGQSRTIYSLRHTAIMLRLTKGDKIDLITLARNARTSVEMIDKFYAKYLTAEMNLEKLQSL
jgi:integrase